MGKTVTAPNTPTATSLQLKDPAGIWSTCAYECVFVLICMGVSVKYLCGQDHQSVNKMQREGEILGWAQVPKMSVIS